MPGSGRADGVIRSQLRTAARGRSPARGSGCGCAGTPPSRTQARADGPSTSARKLRRAVLQSTYPSLVVLECRVDPVEVFADSILYLVQLFIEVIKALVHGRIEVV